VEARSFRPAYKVQAMKKKVRSEGTVSQDVYLVKIYKYCTCQRRGVPFYCFLDYRRLSLLIFSGQNFHLRKWVTNGIDRNSIFLIRKKLKVHTEISIQAIRKIGIHLRYFYRPTKIIPISREYNFEVQKSKTFPILKIKKISLLTTLLDFSGFGAKKSSSSAYSSKVEESSKNKFSKHLISRFC
jgi:hypothetical protein